MLGHRCSKLIYKTSIKYLLTLSHVPQMDSLDAKINIPMDSTHFEIQMILEKTFEKIYYLITPGMKKDGRLGTSVL